MTPAEQLEAIADYAQTILGQDTSGHSLDHLERVVNLARKLQQGEGGDLFLIEAGAYLHDVTDDKLVPDVAQAESQLVAFLTTLGLTPTTIVEIQFIIEHVSFSRSLAYPDEVLSLEAKIVQDADRLDAIGAIGIGRTFYYGGHAGHKMYDPDILPRENMTKAEYRVNQTVLNHFYEKLLLLPERLQTETARELAKPRQATMHAFLAAFKAEWEGN